MKFLHENERFEDVLEAVASEMKISMSFVEKDYWIMHSLYELLNRSVDLLSSSSLEKY